MEVRGRRFEVRGSRCEVIGQRGITIEKSESAEKRAFKLLSKIEAVRKRSNGGLRGYHKRRC